MVIMCIQTLSKSYYLRPSSSLSTLLDSRSCFELRPSSSLSTLLDSRSRCSWRSACVSGVVVFHCMVLKLQKPAPIDFIGGSQEPSPAVHAPSKPKAPKSPDSVPSQYSFSSLSRSTMYVSFPTLCCGAVSAFVSES